ncbi:Uncharacterised protein [Starkeya nomas]|uniref:Uncharacterized protein n=1 Tax=Starkeya nomas TaxID=2666134 RepID=A0A5S9R429_9HYPH|nr:Uncharacterised protein [Starkeya nomas]
MEVVFVIRDVGVRRASLLGEHPGPTGRPRLRVHILGEKHRCAIDARLAFKTEEAARAARAQARRYRHRCRFAGRELTVVAAHLELLDRGLKQAA